VTVASAFTPGVAELLFEVSPHDPVVVLSETAVLLLVSLVASLVPGLRATRVDPIVALRSE
jgi:ABC-type lipoprotein release transport system permease subunit